MGNPYLPEKAVIRGIKEETSDTKTYILSFADEERQKAFTFKPGQFNQLTIFGVGEAPLSISSSPDKRDSFDHTVKSVGNVTNALARLREGNVVGVRGPYGSSWPLEVAKGKDVLIVAGGVGLAPLRSFILHILENRGDFWGLEIMYGARAPLDMLFHDEFEVWGKGEDVHLWLTVDRVPEGQAWKHDIGVVTVLFANMRTSPKNAIVATCGPEIMMRFVIRGLLMRGFGGDQIYVSLERRMECGIGKCGHCLIGPKYVCLDGPVFRYDEIAGLPDKIL